jgi:hypothetical protein
MTLSPTPKEPNQALEAALFQAHDAYKEWGLPHRRFRHQDLLPLLEALGREPAFTVTKVGESVEGREISLVKIGSGATRVLLWSQMHGDEATATMALFDLFRFFRAQDEFDPLRETILAQTTLYFLPLLNPDGAERHQRRNALGIDLNRDALQLQSPEAQLLKHLRDTLQPDFGFNLHDQNPLYSVGQTGRPATLSFLAPPFDAEKSVNAVRARAMQLIVLLNRRLQPFIPGQIGKWPDDFEPRAFGDNIQKWGTSVVLLESGGYHQDPEKQFIRKLNFVTLLAGLQAIATKAYERENLQEYAEIPENGPLLFDLILRNFSARKGEFVYRTDLGIVRAEHRVPGQPALFYRSTLAEMGDLSVFSGYEDRDLRGLRLAAGRVYPVPFATVAEVATADLHHLLRQGYLFVRVEEKVENTVCFPLPINIIIGEATVDPEVQFEGDANFVLLEGEEPRLAVVNGFLYDLDRPLERVHNGLAYR